jgi:hypothetical protein
VQGFSVESQRIAATGATVTDVGAGLGREIAAMDGILGSISVAWQSSDAAPRFVSVMRGHLDQVTVLRDALMSHGESLAGAGRRFAEVESVVAGALPAAS